MGGLLSNRFHPSKRMVGGAGVLLGGGNHPIIVAVVDGKGVEKENGRYILHRQHMLII
jgi:hypothetical protein